jgi:hypothetical protein
MIAHAPDHQSQSRVTDRRFDESCLLGSLLALVGVAGGVSVSSCRSESVRLLALSSPSSPRCMEVSFAMRVCAILSTLVPTFVSTLQTPHALY